MAGREQLRWHAFAFAFGGTNELADMSKSRPNSVGLVLPTRGKGIIDECREPI